MRQNERILKLCDNSVEQCSVDYWKDTTNVK